MHHGSSDPPARRSPFGLLLSLRFPVLVVVLLACAVGTFDAHNDWNGFAWGADLVFGVHRWLPDLRVYPGIPGGLHVFANYPFLQMGPVSLLVAEPLRWIGPHWGQYAAAAFISAIGILSIVLLERTRRVLDPSPRAVAITTLVGGLLVMPAWAELAAHYTHLDDALAIGGVVVALWCVATDRAILLGIALGLAIGSKTWAAGFLPLAFALPGRKHWYAATAAVVTASLAWLPFVLGDTRTASQLGRFGLPVSASVPIWLAGIHRIGDPGQWRSLQFVAEIVVALVLVRLGGWQAVPVVCVAVRLLLDPFDYSYYAAALLMTALAFDLLWWRRPVPWVTALSALAVVSHLDGLTTPTPRAVLRLVCYLAVLLLTIGAVTRRHSRTRRHGAGSPEGDPAPSRL